MTNNKKSALELKQEIKAAAELDIVTFVNIVRPELYLGDIHKRVLRECGEIVQSFIKGKIKKKKLKKSISYKLIMLPRGHLKSQMMALICAYAITIKPDITILYCSENTQVVQGQLDMIKKVLESPKYRLYWNEMVNVKKSQRTKWTMNEFTVDHPIRKSNLSVREPTVVGKTVGQSFTGAHFDLAFCDDLVTKDNAYTEAGREKVKDFFSALMAIMSSGSKIIMAGTPYHPRDLYTSIEDIEYEDNEGVSHKLFDITIEVVEKDGVFLWPRSLAPDGNEYGFDREELSKKKATTNNPLHFYSQYYMNPQAMDGERIGYNNFKYYDYRKISVDGNGKVYYDGKELYITAAMDFAFSLRKSADATAIVVAGMDVDGNIYVLDIVEFKTLKINEMYRYMMSVYRNWKFKTLRAETVAAQEAVVEQLIDHVKENKVKGLKIIKYKPNRHDGNKEERMAAQLEPVYQNEKVYHNKHHKLNNKMESELVSLNPAHDDIKNAFADALMDLRKPRRRITSAEDDMRRINPNSHSRFGGYN